MIDHKELLAPDSYSQEVESLKAHYTLTKEKFSRFERDCYGRRSRLDQVSPFLEKANLHKSSSDLVVHIVELKGVIKEEKWDYH